MSKESPSFGARLKDLRYRNTSGKVIPMHHAFQTLRMNSGSRISAIILPLLFAAILWLALPLVTVLWGNILEFWMQNLYDGHASYSPMHLLGLDLNIPYPVIYASLPSVDFSYWNLVVCIIVFILSFLVPPNLAPFNYLMRSMLIIQASASLDRMLSPDFFPYDLSTYIRDMLYLSIHLLFALPVVLGFVYYVFDFGLWRKFLLTALMLGYFIVAIPCQYMLHSYIIHEWSLLFLPIMYLLFGALLDVMMFIAIYSIGMSWHNKKAFMQPRGL